MLEAPGAIDGYVGEELYRGRFHRQFTLAVDRCDAAPSRPRPARRENRAPFSLLDLSCGDGLALVGFAVAYAGLTNDAFLCGRFAEIDDEVAPTFDYVTAQGVQP